MNDINSKSVEKALQQKIENEKQWLKGNYGLFPKTQRVRRSFTDEELDVKLKEEILGVENAKNHFNNNLEILAKFPIYSIIFPFKSLQYSDEEINRYINMIHYPSLFPVKMKDIYAVYQKIHKINELITKCKKDKCQLTKYIDKLKLETINKNGFNKFTREKIVNQSLENINLSFKEYYIKLENRKNLLEKMLKEFEAERDYLEREYEVKKMEDNQETTRSVTSELEVTALNNIVVKQNYEVEQQNKHHCFIEVTDIEKCKEVALEFLKIPVINLQSHPIFGYQYARRGYRIYDLTQNPNIVKRIIDENRKKIKTISNYIEFSEIFKEIWQQMNFLEKTKSYIDQNDYSKFLRQWIFMIQHHNEYHKIAIDYLKKTNKEYLMTSNELENYSKLEKSVTIYKSLKGKDDVENLNSLDWYLDYETARKNVNRIRPYIYKVKVDKNDIFMYYSGWREITLIIDFTKTYDLELVEEVIFPDEETIKKQRVIEIAKDEIDEIMQVDLSICNEELQLENPNRDSPFISEKEKLMVEFNCLKFKAKQFENLRKKIQRNRNKAFKYLQDRRKNENFKKIAYLECIRYLNKVYINQIKCITKPLFLYNRELIKIESKKRKLELKD